MLFAGIRAHPRPLNRADFTLPLAYAEAVEKLRLNDTLKHVPKDDQLYCVSAKLSTNTIASGLWTFEFSGANGSRRFVMVHGTASRAVSWVCGTRDKGGQGVCAFGVLRLTEPCS